MMLTDMINNKMRENAKLASSIPQTTDLGFAKHFNKYKPYHLPCMNVVHSLGALASLAYETHSYILRDELMRFGLESDDSLIFDFEDVDTQCFIAYDDNNVVLSFRGTESAVDWANDFDFPLISFGSGGQMAHRGFCTCLHLNSSKFAFNMISEKLKELATDGAGRNIWVTGHSLGGALATLFVGKHKDIQTGWFINKLKGLYTYGAPKVGNGAFFDNMHPLTLEGKYFRCVNDDDGVPMISPPIPGYKHGGTHVHFESGLMRVYHPEGVHEVGSISTTNGAALFKVFAPPMLKLCYKGICMGTNHLMQNYLKSISLHLPKN